MSTTAVTIDDKQLNLSNLEKVLYPESGFRKGEVIDYYVKVAPVLLPHMEGRPLTLKRYPNGVNDEFFYEKRCPSYKPKWIPTARVQHPRSQNVVNYCLVDEPATLAWVANLASLELHTLLCTAEDLERPTAMVFDLDPGPPATILDCLPVAFRLRDMFKHAGLAVWPKTSGGKGLHLWVPLNTAVTFDDTKSFSREMAHLLERHDPQHVISNMKKELRAGKIFIDWSQNDRSKTTVCVYSLRARARPTVSTPVTWQELLKAHQMRDASKLVFEAKDVLARVKRRGDLFEEVLTTKQRLPALRRLAS
jgi:bifunctional non-homologous end joining protein LigD